MTTAPKPSQASTAHAGTHQPACHARRRPWSRAVAVVITLAVHLGVWLLPGPANRPQALRDHRARSPAKTATENTPRLIVSLITEPQQPQPANPRPPAQEGHRAPQLNRHAPQQTLPASARATAAISALPITPAPSLSPPLSPQPSPPRDASADPTPSPNTAMPQPAAADFRLPLPGQPGRSAAGPLTGKFDEDLRARQGLAVAPAATHERTGPIISSTPRADGSVMLQTRWGPQCYRKASPDGLPGATTHGPRDVWIRLDHC